MKELFNNWFTYLSGSITIILILIPQINWEMKVILFLLTLLISFSGSYFKITHKFKLVLNDLEQRKKTITKLNEKITQNDTINHQMIELEINTKQKIEDLEAKNAKLVAENTEMKNLIYDYKLLASKSESFLNRECEHIKEIYADSLTDVKFKYRGKTFLPIIQVFSNFKTIFSQKINDERRDFGDRLSTIQSRENNR